MYQINSHISHLDRKLRPNKSQNLPLQNKVKPEISLLLQQSRETPSKSKILSQTSD